MDEIPSFVILLAILALLSIAGGLLVWLVGYIRGGGKTSPGGRGVFPTSAGATTLSEIQPGTQELLRVSRTEKGELAVFVQGRPYHHLREIKDPRLGCETVEAFKALFAFAEGWLPALRQGAAQSTSPQSVPSNVDEEAFLEQLRQADLFPLEKKPPGLFGGLTQRRVSRPHGPLLTPADAINDLVQQKLEEQPSLARYNIRVATGADGGLSIHVGLQTYTTVDGVSPPEVQTLIQDAIREWQEG